MTKAEILKKEILRQYRSVRQFAMEMNIFFCFLVFVFLRVIEVMAYVYQLSCAFLYGWRTEL